MLSVSFRVHRRARLPPAGKRATHAPTGSAGLVAAARIEARMDRVEADLTSVKERLSRIEGWVAGRFREETAPSS